MANPPITNIKYNDLGLPILGETSLGSYSGIGLERKPGLPAPIKSTSGIAPASTVNKSNISDTSKEEVKPLSFEEMKGSVNDAVIENTKKITAPPMYLKPAFFLDKFAPYLKVEVAVYKTILINGKPKHQEYKFNLLGDEAEEINNHLIRFKMVWPPTEKTHNVEIELIDIKQEIIDFFVLQLQTLQQKGTIINLDVTFGWYHDPMFHPSLDIHWDKIMFTNTVRVLFNNLKVNFQTGGIPVITLFGSTDGGALPGHLRFYTPYNILGPIPAEMLCITEIIKIFEDTLETFRNNPSLNPRSVNDLLYSVLFYKGIKDNKVIQEIIRSGIEWHFNRDEEKLKPDPKLIPKLINILEKTSKPLPVTKNGLGNLPSQLMTVQINQMTSLVNFEKSEENEDFKDQINYHTYYIGYLKKQKTKHFLNFFLKLGIAVESNFVIHPYFIWRYSINLFRQQCKSDHAVPKTHLISIDGSWIDYKAMYPDPFGEESQKEKTLTNVPKFLKSNFLFDNTDKAEGDKAFYKLVKDLKTSSGESWGSYLNKICNSMKFRVEVPQKGQEKFKSTFNIQDKEVKTQNNKQYVPLGANINFFSCNGIAAKKNLDVYIQAMQIKQESLKNSSNESLKKEVNKNIEKWEGKKRSIINHRNYMFIIRDVIPSDGILNPFISENTILQAYSFIPSDLINEKFFNHGVPSCLDVNFPDVFSFQPEFNYAERSRSIAHNAQIVGGYKQGDDIFKDSVREAQVEKLTQDIEDLKKKIGNNKEEKESISKQIEEKNTELSKLSGPSVSANPITFYNKNVGEPLYYEITNFSDYRIYGGNLNMALERKKQVQELRKKIMFEAIGEPATMEVIGDPTFVLENQLGKHLFIKVLNMDGSLSYFSGLYMLRGFTHELTASNYKTTFNIINDNKDDASLEELKTLIYRMDRQNVTHNQ